MRTNLPPVDVLRRQAHSLSQTSPELFHFLTQRDEATFELMQALVRGIPDPDHLPTVRNPFIDVVIEAMAPAHDCQDICGKPPTGFVLLDERRQAALCDLCRNGLYLRGSSLAALVG